VRSHEERTCSILETTQSPMTPIILEHTKIKSMSAATRQARPEYTGVPRSYKTAAA